MTVSILIPCYNVEQYLPQCLDSVVNQTYNDLQVVLVDDGSTDNTLSIAQEYAKKDTRIEVYHQENQGVAAARNTLLSKIKGDYFLFVDSDDWLELNMVEFLVGKAQESSAEMVMCGMVVNDTIPSADYTEEIWNQEKTIREFVAHVNMNGSLWNKLTNVTLLHNDRFHHGISYGEDALFCWHILQHITKLHVANKQLYHYRMNNQSLSHQKWNPEKKGTGSIVWQTISEECKHWWPKFADVAEARRAIEEMWCLYFAALTGYQYDENIRVRQQYVKKSLSLIRRSGLVSTNKLFFAWVSCHWYGFGWTLRMMRRIKRQRF